MIRVVVADDHALVRGSIRALLDRATDIEVVGEAGDGGEAVALAHELEPDLILMDVAMPELDGLAATRQIRRDGLEARVIILSMYANQNLVQQALEIGARGYLLKRTVSDELLPAIAAVLRDDVFLSRALTA